MRIPVARRRLGMRIRTSKSGEPTGALDSNKHLHRLTEQGGTLLDPRQSSSLVNKLVIQCDRRAHSIPLHQTAHHDVVHDAEHQANGRGSSDRSRAEILPISTRNWTDLEPEADRSRHGTRPISSRKRTDLDAELDRSRQQPQQPQQPGRSCRGRPSQPFRGPGYPRWASRSPCSRHRGCDSAAPWWAP